jgi:N4-gp56 family major capsid protein
MSNTLGTLTAEAKQYYDRNLMIRVRPVLYLAMIVQARNIPANSGDQVSYRRFNQISTATTPLTESVSPTPSALSLTEVTGTVAEYGNVVQISDMLAKMGIDQVMSESQGVLAENGGQSIEEIIRAEVVTGSGVLYATGSSRGAQSASNPITLSLVRKAVRNLNANNAVPFYGARNMSTGQGGRYIGYIHPMAWYDLVGDTQVLNTFSYSDPEKMYEWELPDLAGVAWVVSSKAPVFTGAGSGGADVYGTMIFGKDAFGVVDVAGTQGRYDGSGRIGTIVKALGSAGTEDPLDQRATVGWKSLQLPKILNNNFFTRIEAGVTA